MSKRSPPPTVAEVFAAVPPRCAGCVHWHRGEEDVGECHRYPPTPMHDAEDGAWMMWAVTEATERCGEFRPAN